MARQTITLGANPFDGANIWRGAERINAALIHGGGPAFLRHIQFFTSGYLYVLLSTTATEADNLRGPDFTDAVEQAAAAFTFAEAGGRSVVVGGPDAPGANADDTEPYLWQPPGGTDAFRIWRNGLGSGIVTLTIDDAAGTSPDPDPDPPGPDPPVTPSLAVSPGTLTPAFDATVTSYTVEIDHPYTSFDVDVPAGVAGGGPYAIAKQPVTVRVTMGGRDYALVASRPSTPPATTAGATVPPVPSGVPFIEKVDGEYVLTDAAAMWFQRLRDAVHRS